MDQPQYSTVMQVLNTIPDPRKARGKQLEWPFILGVIASAIVSQQHSIAAMAQWTKHHAATLIDAFQPPVAGCQVKLLCCGPCAIWM